VFSFLMGKAAGTYWQLTRPSGQSAGRPMVAGSLLSEKKESSGFGRLISYLRLLRLRRDSLQTLSTKYQPT
jgi:hypothetical protein